MVGIDTSTRFISNRDWFLAVYRSSKRKLCMFQDSLTANLLRLIQKMKPKTEEKKKKKKKKKDKDKEKENGEEDEKLTIRKHMFPGLALPNDPNVKVS